MDGEPTTPQPKKHWYQRPWLVIILAVVVVILGVFLRQVVDELVKIEKGEKTYDFSGSSTKDPTATGRSTVERVENVDRIDAPFLGSKQAKVVIVEFGDFECPFCQQAFTTVHAIADAYGDRIRIIYRDFPVTVLHENAQKAAEAGRCALELGGNETFWKLHDRMFINQEDLTVPALKRYGALVGLDQKGFDECLDSNRFRSAVQSDYLAGTEAGVTGTPTFFFNGLRIPGVIPEDIFKLLIERELANVTES